MLTMHGRLDLDFLRDLMPRYRSVPLVSISDDQRRSVADLDLTWAATVYNGLDLSAYAEVPHDSEGYLGFVGRISEEKGPVAAIEIARRSGLPLRMAAKVDPLDEEYYEQEVKPHMGHGVNCVGEIDDSRSPGFYAGARATLFPSDWPEPFGLVMIESLAAGTPVIALRRGSVPEVIINGVTGFICGGVDDEMAEGGRADRGDRPRGLPTPRPEVLRRGDVPRLHRGLRTLGRSAVPTSRPSCTPAGPDAVYRLTSNCSQPGSVQRERRTDVTRATGGPAPGGRGAAGRGVGVAIPASALSRAPGRSDCGPGCWIIPTGASASAWWPPPWCTC